MQIAATQVVMLYLVVLVGFVSDKLKLFTEETARKVTTLLLYVVVPFMIVNSFLSIEKTDETVRQFFISLILAFATHFIAIAINTFFFRKKNDLNPIFKYASIYGNVGYMALPLAQALLGAEGLFYCSNAIIAFYMIVFTHGASLMSKEEQKINIKKIFFNPGVLGVAIGLPLFLLEVELPSLMMEPIEMMASLNTPIGMLIFGTYLANTDLKTMFTEKRIYLVALIKLLIVPLVCVGLYSLLGVSGVLLTACAISASVPCASNTFMFAAQYGRDTGVASKTTALVSFISIITMPFIIALAQSV